MSLTDQPLFRSRGFEPLGALGDVLFLLDRSGPISKYTTPFFVIAGMQPAFGLTPHGFLTLWNQAGAVAVAGYGLTPGATTTIPELKGGSIGAGASVTVANPQILQGDPLQLVQWRFSVRSLALTGIKEHDIEVQVTAPGLAPLFGVSQASPGYINELDAFQDPADAIDAPAQGANQTLPAAYPSVHPKDDANFREFMVWEDNGPSFKIWNNGSASVTAGAVGLRLWGIKYDLNELDPRLLANGTGQDRWLYGQIRRCPPTDRPIRVIPTAPYSAQVSH